MDVYGTWKVIFVPNAPRAQGTMLSCIRVSVTRVFVIFFGQQPETTFEQWRNHHDQKNKMALQCGRMTVVIFAGRNGLNVYLKL